MSEKIKIEKVTVWPIDPDGSTKLKVLYSVEGVYSELFLELSLQQIRDLSDQLGEAVTDFMYEIGLKNLIRKKMAENKPSTDPS